MPVTTEESEGKRRRGRGPLLLAALLPLLALLGTLALAPLANGEQDLGPVGLAASVLPGRDLGYHPGFNYSRGSGKRWLVLRLGSWYWGVGIR
jgi:hypothetical protein